MSFLYPFIFFALVPLYLFYKKNIQENPNKKGTTLLYLSLAFIFLALSRPVLEDSLEEEKFDAQEYIIALDASYSMQATDLKPTRYEVAKEAIKKLLHLHQNDRFTLFIFTSNPLLISPPTTDTAISILALDAINPHYILTKSTSLTTLFKSIAQSPFEKKNLIIFSDGGEEHNLNTLLSIAKKANIHAFIIATASKDGSALKKNGQLLKDAQSNIVISRINPLLKPLALKSGGYYYELNSNHLKPIEELSTDLTTQTTKKESIQVKKYKELFFIPLCIALLLFFLAVTKLHQFFIFIPLFFLPQPSNAGLFDFYYLSKAKEAFTEKKYLSSAKNFQKVDATVESYLNMATAYYKAGHYKKALELFSSIQSPDAKIKQRCFYAMGNIAVQLKRYDRAKKYYLQSLALGEDNDALYNLNLLHKLQLKTMVNLIDMLPEKNAQTKKSSSKSTSQQKDKKNSTTKKKSNRSAQGSAGKGDAKTTKEKKALKKEPQNNQFKMGYKAYELINKGYTNENTPW